MLGLIEGTGKLALPAIVLSSFVVGLGLWSIADEKGMPFWTLVVCHVCDIGCHSIMAAALVGSIFDFSVAIIEGRAHHFIRHFIRCTDSIERHGVIEEVHGDDDHTNTHMSSGKVTALWLAFFVAACSYDRRYWGKWVPACLAVILDVAGVTCWGGVVWWIVRGLLKPQHGVIHMTSGKSIASSGLSGKESSVRRGASCTTPLHRG